MPTGGLAPKAYAKTADASQKKVTICVGEEKTLKVKNSKGKTHIKWKSLNPKIASVSKKGVIVGKRKGNTEIELSCQKGKGQTAKKIYVLYKVKVGNYIKSMSVSPQNDVKLVVGESMQIQTDIYPVKAKEKAVVYESENNEIASVTAEGVVTAIKEGRSYIRIKSKGKTAKKKNLQAKILVYIETADAASDTGEQGMYQTPDGTGIIDTQNPNQSDTSDAGQGAGSGDGSPTGDGSGTGTSADGDAKQDATVNLSAELQAEIDALPQPDKKVLVPGVLHAVYGNGEEYTLYFINLEYEGNMNLIIGDYSYSLNMPPSTALRRLESMGFTKSNSTNTIRVERKIKADGSDLEEWWKVTELESGALYELKGMRKDTIYANQYGYGVVIIKGDTRDVIKIQ